MAQPASLEQALHCQQRGDTAGAVRLYEAMLAEDPADTAALSLLGLGLVQGSDPIRGLELLHEAVLIDDSAVSHLGLGQALLVLGRTGEAVAAFRRCTLREPKLAAAHAGLGRALHAAGDLPAAEAALRAAIALAPDDAAAHLALGSLLRAAGRPMEAAAAADAAILLQPGDAGAWCMLGNALLEAGHAEAAVAVQERAVALAPELALAQYNLGNALRAVGREEAAVGAFRQALRLQPEFPEALCNLGAALHLLQRFAEAEAAARQTLALRPGMADAMLNLGNALQAQFRFAEAAASYRSAYDHAGGAVRIAAAARSNLGTALTALERLDEALAAQSEALALRPDFADAAYNRAITLLTAGDYAAGWPAFEARWRMGWSPPRGFAQPQWQGEELAGRRILLHAEQGLGDTLQFHRFVALVAARGGRVALEVQAPLVRLLRQQPGAPEWVLAQGEALPDFDLHCPLMSLPGAFGTVLETIPPAPYLVADPALVAQWRTRLGEPRPGRRIGLVWAGAARIGYVNSERSIPLREFAPLWAAAPDATFYALQKDATPQDIMTTELDLVNPMPEVADFADTAALVALMDLVISVDTSTAHLAAAMGKPVWLLSRCNGCWRWLTGRSDSPWYPSVRIFRQERPRDWGVAMGRVAEALAQQGR